MIQYTPLTYNNSYVYPWYGQAFGIFLVMSSTIFVPLYFLFALIKAPGLKLKEVSTPFFVCLYTVMFLLKVIDLMKRLSIFSAFFKNWIMLDVCYIRLVSIYNTAYEVRYDKSCLA